MKKNKKEIEKRKKKRSDLLIEKLADKPGGLNPEVCS